MNFLFLLKFFNKLPFAIFLLLLIALSSSLGSIIEQDESLSFYTEFYPKENSLFNYEILLFFKLNEIYTSWWFLFLLFLLSISLVSCTLTTQFPIVSNSKFFFFKEKKKKFQILPFFFKIKNVYYLKEKILTKLQEKNYLFYQKKSSLYSYKGLLGRISPILVHGSLLLLLASSFSGAFFTSKAEQISAKGEISHIQNYRSLGYFTQLSPLVLRCNDFWINSQNTKISQFYSNLSLLTNSGNEILTKTLSVNNPLRYHFVDIYQSDWNIPGIRLSTISEKKYQYPLFFTNTEPKIWITWVNFENENYTLLFQRSFSTFLIYDDKGNFLKKSKMDEEIFSNSSFSEFLYSTGLLLKYNPSIPFIYFGFFLLLVTTVLSYFPYNQLWVITKGKNLWVGGLSNRGKIGFEIELENNFRKYFFESKEFDFFVKKDQKEEKGKS